MPLPIQVCLSPQASPEVFDWLNNSGLASTAWNSTGSWVGGKAPNNNVNDHIARLGQSGAITGSITTSGNSIRGIMIPGNAPAITLYGTGITIGAYGIQKWSTTTLTLTAPVISGIGGIQQYGNGTITSSGAHTFTGPIYLHQGTLVSNNFSAAGTAGGMGASGVLFIGSGWGTTKATTCGITINSTQTMTWDWVVNWSVSATNNTFTLTNNTNSGSITWNPVIKYQESTSRTLILTGTGSSTQKIATALANPVGGSLSLTVNGVGATGIWELTGASSYSGNTSISSAGAGNTLRLAAGASLGNTAVTVDATTAVNTLEGPSTSGGTATIAGSVALTGITYSNIRAGRFGNNTLNIGGSLSFSNGVATGPRMTVDVTETTVSNIVVTGTCNFASATNKSTVWFTTGTTPAAGTYALITAGTMTGTLPTVGQQPTGRTATLAFNGNKLQVTFT